MLRPLMLLFIGCLALRALAAGSSFEQIARRAYTLARAAFESDPTKIHAAWHLAQAAYELADLLDDDAERNKIAETGINASRTAISLNPQSAAGHYYLALNLGERARAKKLGAIKILHEMERELLKAVKLDEAFDYAGPDRALGMLYLEAPVFPLGVGNRNKARSHLETAVQLKPDYPDNLLCLAEAYAQWGEVKSLDAQLDRLNALLPKAKSTFSGEVWAASWHDWESRLEMLEKTRNRLEANPRVSPSERGARRGVK